jgi:hypothetical protein
VGGKVGVRASNNDLLNETAISPRISFAYKMAKTVSSPLPTVISQTQVQITSNILTINLRARKHRIIF